MKKKTAVKKVLVLRTCNADMTSHHEKAKGFKWPISGPVECSDWNPKPECGSGLHGLRWGQGDWTQLSSKPDAKWLIVEVDADGIVEIKDGARPKVKFQRGNVVYCGNSRGAISMLREAVLKDVVLGKKKKATTGDSAHSSTTGNSAHSSTTGNSAHSSTTGDSAHSSTTGYSAHSSTTGAHSAAACLGFHGRAMAKAENGVIVLAWWDGTRRRIAVGYVGENIKSGQWYSVDGKGNFVEVDGGGK